MTSEFKPRRLRKKRWCEGCEAWVWYRPCVACVARAKVQLNCERPFAGGDAESAEIRLDLGFEELQRLAQIHVQSVHAKRDD